MITKIKIVDIVYGSKCKRYISQIKFLKGFAASIECSYFTQL